MDSFTNNADIAGAEALPGCLTNCAAAHKPASLWRPWINEQNRQTTDSRKPYWRPKVTSSGSKADKWVAHPVKLFWPRSRCFDYMYQDAEVLLQNYPVQATICLYEDSSDEEDSDVEDEKP